MLRRFRYILTIVSGLLLCAGGFVTCVDKQQKQASQPTEAGAVTADSSRYSQFAGSASCAACHRDIYQEHLKTAHYLTTRRSDSSNILGPVEAPQNKFYFNPGVYLAVERRDSLT